MQGQGPMNSLSRPASNNKSIVYPYMDQASLKILEQLTAGQCFEVLLQN